MSAPLLSPIILSSANEDMAAITNIYAHHVLHATATFEEEPPSVQEMAARRAKVLANGFPYLVAKDAETHQVLGYAYANFFHARSAYRFTIENSVYVDANYHGRGVGKALLAALLKQCQMTGAKQMLALISGDNPASIRLHEALGFVLIGTQKSVGYKFNRWLDVVMMQKAL